MNIFLNFYADLVVVLLAIIVGIYQWKRLELIAKIFFTTMVWYFLVQLVTEGGLLYHLKDRFSEFYYLIRGTQSIVDFILCVAFFYFGIDRLRKKRKMLYLVPAAIVAWLACIYLFRNTENFNVYFAPIACLGIIILSIVALYYLQSEHTIDELIKMPVFRFTVLLLFYYGGYFFFLVSYPLLLKNREAELLGVYIIFRITNVYYIGAGLTYFLYPKKVMQIE